MLGARACIDARWLPELSGRTGRAYTVKFLTQETTNKEKALHKNMTRQDTNEKRSDQTRQRCVISCPVLCCPILSCRLLLRDSHVRNFTVCAGSFSILLGAGSKVSRLPRSARSMQYQCICRSTSVLNSCWSSR